nr:type VI secretion system tip protein VgrG [Chitinivorax tropicus]
MGADVLLFQRMSGQEQMGRLGEYQLEVLCENAAISFDDLLGKPMTVSIRTTKSGKRHFHGYVTQMASLGLKGRFAVFRVTLRPWLWFLTRAADCRIFQEKSVLDIIKEVFEAYGCADYSLTCSGQAPQQVLPYCVQYRETDFNFVSRLMEQTGIYYYFKHGESRHELVLCDALDAHGPAPDYAKLPFSPFDERDIRRGEDIFEWSASAEIQPGAYTLKDFDFEKASASTSGALLVKSTMSRQHDQSKYEVFDYPGLFAERAQGEAHVRHRLEGYQAQVERFEGRTMARGLFPGAIFEMTEHPVSSQNGKYLVVSMQYELAYNGFVSDSTAQPDPVCLCHFTAVRSQVQYRPQRITPKPFVQGPQTAIVVGKSGEEIWTDKYGRIKVQFHWDRVGAADEKSSCWLRVAQLWAGKRWGTVFIPRVGMEVVVDFLEGDPDRPLVTGAVYNADNMPPYALPSGATRSAIKSDSTKGSGGFNEIRLEDKKGSEQLFIHAQKNQDNYVKEEAYQWVGKDRHTMVKGNDLLAVDGAFHIHVKGKRNEKVGGNVSLDAGQNHYVKAGQNHAVDAGMNAHLKAGMGVVIEAGMSITLKAGGGFIVIGPTGVSISGTPILLNSGGAAGNGCGGSPEAPDAAKEADDGSK